MLKIYVYPELPVYDSQLSSSSFLMKYFNSHSNLFDNKYTLIFSFRNEEINDDKAIAIISTLFAYLEVLHRAGFILGDINPDNILLDKSFMPAIVDFDSAQLGTYYSNTKRQDYIDPSIALMVTEENILSTQRIATFMRWLLFVTNLW